MKRILVAILAAGVFSALCWDASKRLPDVYPSIGLCFRENPKHHGKRVWMSPHPVLETRPYSFDVESYDTRVRVHSLMRPAIGAEVMVYGTFRRDLSIDAIRCQEVTAYDLKKKAVYLLSFFVLAVGAWFFRRAFVWRDGAFHPRESHSAVASQNPMDGN